MQFWKYLGVLISSMILAGNALAHTGHNTQTSLHHGEGAALFIFLIITAIAAAPLAVCVYKNKRK